jgi:hypothetical protein
MTAPLDPKLAFTPSSPHFGESVSPVAKVVTDEQATLNAVTSEWLSARNVISDTLQRYGMPSAVAHARAASIIARLAKHDPPILLEMQTEKPQHDPLTIALAALREIESSGHQSQRCKACGRGWRNKR